jgi:hypothetical protein
MMNHAMNPMIKSPAIVHPTPIPASAPVLSPPPEPELDGLAVDELLELVDVAAPVTAVAGTVYVAVKSFGAGAVKISWVGESQCITPFVTPQQCHVFVV